MLLGGPLSRFATTGPGSPHVFEPEELGQRKDELALALREARKHAGLTGERLAARCGISRRFARS